MAQEVYDVIVVGGGPAGMTAAIYAKRANLQVAVIEKGPAFGGQILYSERVDNYPGLLGINGYDLAFKIKEHIENLEVTVIYGECEHVTEEEGIKKIQLTNQEIIRTRNIIAAAGANHRHLEVPGERKFIGRGVSFCATCDGNFFRGQDVMVVGGGEVAFNDVIFLSKICNRIHLVHRRDEFRVVSSRLEEVKKLSNVEMHLRSEVIKVQGDEVLSSVIIKSLDDEKIEEVKVSGLFVAVGMEPETKWLQNSYMEQQGLLDNKGYIIAGEDCQTVVDGLYAAGDIRTKKLRQVVTAVSDGANAVNSILLRK